MMYRQLSGISLVLLSHCLVYGCDTAPAQAEVKLSQVAPVKATGELVAATSFKASPPSVSQLWQYNIKELAAESSLLKAGDMVVSFNSQTIAEQLSTKTVELQSARQELANRLQQDEQRYYQRFLKWIAY